MTFQIFLPLPRMKIYKKLLNYYIIIMENRTFFRVWFVIMQASFLIFSYFLSLFLPSPSTIFNPKLGFTKKRKIIFFSTSRNQFCVILREQSKFFFFMRSSICLIISFEFVDEPFESSNRNLKLKTEWLAKQIPATMTNKNGSH